MNEYTIRALQAGDEPRLKALATGYFGQAAETFQRLFLKNDGCLLAEKDGSAPGAAYLLPGCGLFPYRKNTLSAGCVCALASDPGMRAALAESAARTLLATEDLVCFLPAGEAEQLPEGAEPIGFVKQLKLKKAELSGLKHGMTARIDPGAYYGIREGLLNNLPHAVYSEELYDLLDTMIGGAGGGFFMTETGVAAAVMDGPVCRVLELLEPNGDGMTSLAGIAAYCPAEEYIVRSPLFFDVPGESKPFVYGVMGKKPDYPMPHDLWWGFGLD